MLALEQENEKLRIENDRLRGIIAKSNIPCIYCNLAAEDINKCSSGFPGCGRMDDLISDPDLIIEDIEDNNDDVS